MKKWIILLTTLVSASLAHAGPLAPETYGKAQADGSVNLWNSFEDQKNLGSGDVTVEVSRVNFFKSPIQFARGARRVVITQGANDFVFEIPANATENDGAVVVNETEADQSASISISEKTEYLNSHEEEGSTSCTYYGYCYSCGLGMDGKSDCGMKYGSCSGSQDAIFRIDNFKRNVQILISKDGASSKITTEPVPVQTRNFIKTTSSCN